MHESSRAKLYKDCLGVEHRLSSHDDDMATREFCCPHDECTNASYVKARGLPVVYRSERPSFGVLYIAAND